MIRRTKSIQARDLEIGNHVRSLGVVVTLEKIMTDDVMTTVRGTAEVPITLQIKPFGFRPDQRINIYTS